MDDLGPFRELLCRGKTYEIIVKVPPEDYDWAVSQGNWFITHGATGTKHKQYAVRSVSTGLIWLHKCILERHFILPPSTAHTIGDHLNGNSLDDRLKNLRWATVEMNGRNLYGFAHRQRELEL